MTTGSSDGRKKLGDWGESLAAIHLESLGYRILERNWRCRAGEIDLIAVQQKNLHFVEVRTRRGRRLGSPEESLTDRKLKRLHLLAGRYVGDHDLDIDWQIDLVAVELDRAGKLIRCEHIPNIVLGW